MGYARFIRDSWIEQMAQNMRVRIPEASDSDLVKMVTDIYDEKFTDHDAILYNNYENEVSDVTLGGILDWIQVEDPLICESGCFFYQRSKKRNLNTEIVRHEMLDKRAIAKKEMFELLKVGDDFGASVKNLKQANYKKAANSGYGASSERSSFLFNLHSAMSTTSCGRGQLSTACQCFDNLFADFVKFMNMDEFHTYINHIICEAPLWEFETMDVIDKVPSKKKFVKRFVRKFKHQNFCKENVIENLYDMLDDEMRCRLYYKSNLHEFFMNYKVRRIIEKIAYSETEFVNPNEVPPELMGNVELLKALVLEFVGYRYSFFRYEDRTKYEKRSIVIAMDTDSCFLTFGPVVKFIKALIPEKMYHKDLSDTPEKFDNRIMNTMACIASAAVHQTLGNYLTQCRVPKKDHKLINMKNEFHLSRFVATFAKKSYISLRVRQENNILDPPELDVKGVNFFKSTASKKTTDFIYSEILMKQILQSKDGKIRTSRIHKKIQAYQNKMADEIRSGDMGYLKRSIRVKSPDAYKNPMRIGQYKAVYIWNEICEEKDRIVLPSTVTLVKVQLRNKKDCAALNPWPEIYERVMYLFDHDIDVGGGTDSSGNKIPVKGIKAIALPNDMDEVPDWVLAVIDVETLIGDNMKLFTQLYRPLGMIAGTSSHNGSSMSYYMNIVRI